MFDDKNHHHHRRHRRRHHLTGKIFKMSKNTLNFSVYFVRKLYFSVNLKVLEITIAAICRNIGT